MRIVVDAYGGDNAPLEIIKGAADASNQFGCEITLTGNQAEIEKIIAENKLTFNGNLIIVDTDDVISMHDDPTTILKSHSESSMALAFKELAEDINGIESQQVKYNRLVEAIAEIDKILGCTNGN